MIPGKMNRLLSAALVLLLASPALAAPTALVNGKIVTVNPDFAIAEAMLVEGERIVKVGTNAEIREGLPTDATIVDLKGATVLPGLIDSHVHSTGAATHEFDHIIPEMETVADVLAYIRDRATKVPEGTWIGLSQVLLIGIPFFIPSAPFPPKARGRWGFVPGRAFALATGIAERGVFPALLLQDLRLGPGGRVEFALVAAEDLAERDGVIAVVFEKLWQGDEIGLRVAKEVSVVPDARVVRQPPREQ